MSKLYLFLFSVLFLAIYPLAVEAADASKAAFLGPMEVGKGPTDVHYAAVDLLTAGWPKGSWVVCDGEADSHPHDIYHYQLNTALDRARGQSVCAYLRTKGFKTIVQEYALTEEEILKHVSPESRKILMKSQINRRTGKREKGFRGVMIYLLDDRCSEDELKKAFVIKDEVNQQIRPKGDFKVISQKIPAGYEEVVVRLSFKSGEGEEEWGEKITRERASTKKCYLAARKGATARTADKPVPRPLPDKPIEPPYVAIPKELKCSDGIDNDKDGLTDCADPDCEGSAVCGPEDTDARCNDKVDNDGDGFVDCEDKDCMEFCPESVIPQRKETKCSDKVDNDGDGLVDCEDSDCKGTLACVISDWRIGFGLQGHYDFVNSDALNGQMTDEIKQGDLFNGKCYVEVKIPLKKGFSLVPAVEYFTTSSFWALPGDDHLNKEVRQGHFGVQLTLLKKVAEKLEIGVGIGAGLHEDWGLPQFHVVGRYMLDENWFIQGGVEMYLFRHPTEGGKVPVFAPFFGIGFLF